MSEEQILIWLSMFDFMTAKKFHTLIDYYKNPKKIYEAFLKSDNVLTQMFKLDQIEQMVEKAECQYVNNYITNLNQSGVTIITYDDIRYSRLLKQTNDYPFVLYAKGNLELLNTKCLAVVGTRNPSNYGKTVTYDMVKALARSGLTIVSGMATGIDSIAHKASLEIGGNTIAVLGSGFNNIYPKMNENLANEISKKGLLISEYSPNMHAQKYSFIARNRIIAGLSDAIFIPEASKNSGSLHTKEYAYDYNRGVYALPGNINSSVSEGTNMLIASSQAQCVLNYNDILKDYGIEDRQIKQVYQLDIEQQKILDCLKNEPLTFDFLQIKTEIEPKKLNSYLTTMTIRGIIKKLPGNLFSK